MTGIWRQFFLAIFLVALASAILQAEEAQNGIDPSLIIEQFEVFNDGDLLLVPTTVLGKTRLFVLDTGSPGTIYDSRLRPLLGNRRGTARLPGLNGLGEIEIFDAPTAYLRRVEVDSNFRIACTDLSAMREWSGHEIEGIIGMALLRPFVIHLDFDSGKMALLDAAPKDAGVAVPIKWMTTLTPTVEASIDGHGIERFVIDTGMSGPYLATLAPQLMEELQGKGAVDATGSTPSIDLSGKAANINMGRVSQMSIGGFDFKYVRITSHRLSQGNMLGLDFLSRFIVTLDFPNGVMYLKKSKRFNSPYTRQLAGLNLIRRDGQVLVTSVATGGAAADAGIMQDDVLVKLDDEETSGLRLSEIMDRFSSPGKTLRAQIQRGDESISMDLRLPRDTVAPGVKPALR